jgi:curved DNA-binding protein CbpA
MGANQSGESNNSRSPSNPDEIRSRYKLEEQNKLLQEKLKNQELRNKLQVIQNMLEKQRLDSVIQGKSPNALLTNPQLQKEFLRNKEMQKEFLRRIQKNQELNLDTQQYQMVNEYLNKLDVEENELDAKKPYLYMQEPSNRYHVSPGDEKKPHIGTTNSERDKFLRYMRKQKEQQEINMEAERKKRKEEYQNQMHKLDVDSLNPYEVLGINPNSSFNDAKIAFKKKARIYHPDRIGGNTQEFQRITKSFMLLVEEFKKREADKQFNVLKEESRQEIEKQQNQSKRNVNFKKINMSGKNFNQKKFNKIYEENRLNQSTDEGYGKWMQEHDYESLKVPKLNKDSYNAQNFNQQFQQFKSQNSRQLVKHQDPQPIISLKQNYEELGQGNISDFSGENANGKMIYTDYRKAHTETNLIDPDSIDYREYKNVDELERERGKKIFLSKEEQERITMNEMLEKQREEKRRMRLNRQDERAFQQFEKVNQMFLH